MSCFAFYIIIESFSFESHNYSLQKAINFSLILALFYTQCNCGSRPRFRGRFRKRNFLRIRTKSLNLDTRLFEQKISPSPISEFQQLNNAKTFFCGNVVPKRIKEVWLSSRREKLKSVNKKTYFNFMLYRRLISSYNNISLTTYLLLIMNG